MQIEFAKNPKQGSFFELALAAMRGSNEYRHLFYGGAIRGGKTFVSLAVLGYAAAYYPQSRWHIFRRDFPALLATTIPSMQKILAGSRDWHWHRDRSNYYVQHRYSGGKIFFKGESLDQDPGLNDLLGLETNGILYEQIEELSRQIWEVGNSRLGSWYIEPMPKPITLATFNPTQTWVKELIYEPYRTGKLEAPYYYMPALPSDNAYVTDEQWKAWSRLDERYQQQYIQGDWTDFADRDHLWAFAYEPARHIAQQELQPDPGHILYLSFDFNRNPICCSVIQHIDQQIRVLETVKLAQSDVYALCCYIRSYYPQYVYRVTGDASGYHSSALVQDNINYYTVIKNELGLSPNQLHVPTANPALAENQVLVNSLLAHYPIRINAIKAKGLLYDLANVKMHANGTIVKQQRSDPTQQADALDTFRYYCNVFHSGFLSRR
jgi:hypothetical protein